MKLIKVTINDVPEDCKDEVLRLAAVAIDRFYKKQNEVISEEIIIASNVAKNDFRAANNLPKKYDREDELAPE